MSGTLNAGDNEVHITCGGQNLRDNKYTDQCFVIQMGTSQGKAADVRNATSSGLTGDSGVHTAKTGALVAESAASNESGSTADDSRALDVNDVVHDDVSSATMTISRTEPIPIKLKDACYGSDGERFVVAGGWQDGPYGVVGDGFRN